MHAFLGMIYESAEQKVWTLLNTACVLQISFAEAKNKELMSQKSHFKAENDTLERRLALATEKCGDAMEMQARSNSDLDELRRFVQVD